MEYAEDMKKAKLQLKQMSGAAVCGLMGCPALFKTNRGTYAVVGSRFSAKEAKSVLAVKVGKGETVVEIPAHILKKA